MYWLLLLALMLIIPTLAAVLTWRELQRAGTAEGASALRGERVASYP